MINKISAKKCRVRINVMERRVKNKAVMGKMSAEERKKKTAVISKMSVTKKTRVVMSERWLMIRKRSKLVEKRTLKWNALLDDDIKRVRSSIECDGKDLHLTTTSG